MWDLRPLRRGAGALAVLLAAVGGPAAAAEGEAVAMPAEPAACPALVCTWEMTFGGFGVDKASAIAALPDGGMVVVGRSRWHRGSRDDIMLMRIDAGGTLLWQQTFGGIQGDHGTAVAPLADGGFAVAGHTFSAGAGMGDIWVLRLDAEGRQIWDRTYGGTGNERAYGILSLPGGDLVVAGATRSYGAGEGDAWVLRLDPLGEVRWSRSFGGARDEAALDLAPAAGGDLLIAGYTGSEGAGGLDIWAARLSGDGIPRWQARVGDEGFDAASAVIGTGDGGAVVAGRSMAKGEMLADARIVRLSGAGEVVWDRRIGGSGDDLALAVTDRPDAGFVVAGYTASRGAGSADAWLIGLAGDGRTRWERTFGGALWEMATAITGSGNGGLLVGGFTTSSGAGYEDVYVLRLDREGRL